MTRPTSFEQGNSQLSCAWLDGIDYQTWIGTSSNFGPGNNSYECGIGKKGQLCEKTLAQNSKMCQEWASPSVPRLLIWPSSNDLRVWLRCEIHFYLLGILRYRRQIIRVHLVPVDPQEWCPCDVLEYLIIFLVFFGICEIWRSFRFQNPYEYRKTLCRQCVADMVVAK